MTSPAPATTKARIVVTGSRIARQDFKANSPIVTVGERCCRTPAPRRSKSNLNKLPQFAPEKTPTAGRRHPGDADQHPGLGHRLAARHRLQPQPRADRRPPRHAGQRQLAVDINTIPSAAIERVEIISGGASSTYGADAVGGVVNFILKKNFKGLELDGQIGISQQGDGVEYQRRGIMGTNFADGRGNISLAMSTTTREPSLRIDRDWVRDDFANPDIDGNYFFPIYSGITQTGANPAYQTLLNSMFPNRPAGTNVSATGTLYFLGNRRSPSGNSAAGLRASRTSRPAGRPAADHRSSLGTLTPELPGGFHQPAAHPLQFLPAGQLRDQRLGLGHRARATSTRRETDTVQQPGPIVGGWNVVDSALRAMTPAVAAVRIWLRC